MRRILPMALVAGWGLAVWGPAARAQNPLTDDFFPVGTSDLTWALIPSDASGGASPPRFVDDSTAVISAAPQTTPQGDNAVMEIGNLDGALFGVTTVIAGDVTDRDYSIEADVYIVVDGSVRRQVGLMVYNQGNDRFPFELFHNPNGAFSTVGPGFGTRSGGTAAQVHANPTLNQDQWVHMKIDVRTVGAGAEADVFVDWTGDGVDDLDNGNGVHVTGLTDGSSGHYGVFVVTNDPNNDNMGIVNQPHYFDNVTVTFFPRIDPQPQNTGAFVGADATFTVGATGTGTLLYQWRQGGVNLVDGGNVSGATTDTLVISSVQFADDGAQFDVVVTDDIGSSTSQTATLTVLPPPCNDPFADADGDGDVDQTDFRTWQLCHTGPSGVGFDSDLCGCFDRDNNGTVDGADLEDFAACASGPEVPADATCDDFPTGTVVINELVYSHSIDSTWEFIELYNADINPVDISGWTLRASDEVAPPPGPGGDDNPDYTIPGGPASGTVVLAPGDFYVLGGSSVGGHQFLDAPLEPDNEALELIDANGTVKDTVVYELNKGAPAIGTPEFGIWGNTISLADTDQSLSRWVDGLDSDDNGRDFGLRPATPGTSNHALAPAITAYIPADVDAMSPGAAVPGLTGSFVNALVIDPQDASTTFGLNDINPNVIPNSPQGGNAIVAWDPSGGGNMVASDGIMTGNGSYDLWVYLDTSDITVAGAESTVYGLMGTTDSFTNFPDPDANFLGDAVTANGSTGVAWIFQNNNDNNNFHKRLFLVDAGHGGDSSPGANTPIDWTVVQEIDMTSVNPGWYRLTLAYDSATGQVNASFDGQNFNFVTAPGLAGGFYVGYRESLAGTPDTLRPPTFDLRP